MYIQVIYIYIYIYIKIHQRGVQWKQGVVMYMMLYTGSLHNTTFIQFTPIPLHPPVMNTRLHRGLREFTKGGLVKGGLAIIK